MKPTTTKVLFSLLILSSFCRAEIITHEFVYDGLLRDYDVHLPQNYSMDMPLLIILPGYSETKDWFRQYSQVHDHADTSGYVLAIPTGSLDQGGTLSWNIGLVYCPLRGTMPTTDDLGFISAMIDSIHTEYTIDLSRVYCTGFSTGGEMSMRLAAQLGHRLAAVGSVAGTLYDPANAWSPVRNIPLITINGTADNYVFYYHSDSTVFSHSPEEWSVPNMLDFWIEHNACALPADTVDLPNLVEDDNSWIQKISVFGETPNSDIVHYKVVHGGHHWPGGTMNWNNGGNINRDVDGNVTHWEFFQNYENPLTEVAFCDTFYLDSKYIAPEGVSSSMHARLRNPTEHATTVEGIIWGFLSGDSIIVSLNDEGVQGDEISGDGVYGGWVALNVNEEGYFKSTVRSSDIDEALSIVHHRTEIFTTAGPISYLDHSYSDSLIFPGNVIMISLQIMNESDSIDFNDIEVELIPPEGSLANMVGTSSRSYGDMEAGTTAVNTMDFWMRIDSNCPYDTTLTIGMRISSEGMAYWEDQFEIYIQPVPRPATPQGLVAYPEGPFIRLNWHLNEETDLQNYTVYRNTELDTLSSIPVGAVTQPDTSYLDTGVLSGISYVYWLTATNQAGGESWYSTPVTATPVSISGEIAIPKEFALRQNFPNPFNPTTTLSYDLPESSNVKLTVYDVTGRELIALENGDLPAAHYEIQWDGLDASGNPVGAGVYFARIQAGDYAKTIKMVLIH